jgi:hypothetical protein
MGSTKQSAISEHVALILSLISTRLFPLLLVSSWDVIVASIRFRAPSSNG